MRNELPAPCAVGQRAGILRYAWQRLQFRSPFPEGKAYDLFLSIFTLVPTNALMGNDGQDRGLYGSGRCFLICWRVPGAAVESGTIKIAVIINKKDRIVSPTAGKSAVNWTLGVAPKSHEF